MVRAGSWVPPPAKIPPPTRVPTNCTYITPHTLGGLTPPGGGGGKRTRNRLFSDGGSPADEGRVLPWWLRRRYLHLWLQS